ncbi:MAG: hypothetical protein BJ554DRAFT_15 [Olpidium bornovanus]|uniref:Copper-fist domain-containing protein n=1 Tax=Olpidium bornovanus TaxID=278681 RepID=A0A8H7ZUD5_9FUNG|nr:MAG: hypothetical protein BJ554DRAFT_15 [Olpidium bornovanus]
MPSAAVPPSLFPVGGVACTFYTFVGGPRVLAQLRCASCLPGSAFHPRGRTRSHRTSSCRHFDRDLIEIKRKGRPQTQCDSCRDARKSRLVHPKCVCGKPGDAAGKAGPVTAAAAARRVREAQQQQQQQHQQLLLRDGQRGACQTTRQSHHSKPAAREDEAARAGGLKPVSCPAAALPRSASVRDVAGAGCAAACGAGKWALPNTEYQNQKRIDGRQVCR